MTDPRQAPPADAVNEQLARVPDDDGKALEEALRVLEQSGASVETICAIRTIKRILYGIASELGL